MLGVCASNVHDLAVSDIRHSPKYIGSWRASQQSPSPDKKHCELGLTGATPAVVPAVAVAPETRRQIKWQADWLLTGQTPRMGMAIGFGFEWRMQRSSLTFKLRKATAMATATTMEKAGSTTRASVDTHSLHLQLFVVVGVGVGVGTPPFDEAAIAVYVLATVSTRLSARSCLTSCTPAKNKKENNKNAK